MSGRVTLLGAVWGRGQTWAWLVGLWAGPQRCSLERRRSVGVACVGGALCALWGRGQTWAWLVGVGGTTTVLIGERAVGGRGLWVCGRGLCVGGGLGAVWGCGLMWAWFVGVGGGPQPCSLERRRSVGVACGYVGVACVGVA